MIPPASQRLTDMQLGFVASVVEAAARHDLDVLLSPSGGDHDRSPIRSRGAIAPDA